MGVTGLGSGSGGFYNSVMYGKEGAVTELENDKYNSFRESSRIVKRIGAVIVATSVVLAILALLSYFAFILLALTLLGLMTEASMLVLMLSYTVFRFLQRMLVRPLF